MIKADQPTIFPPEVKSAVSSIDDGSMKLSVTTDQQAQRNLQRFCQSQGFDSKSVFGIHVSYGPGRSYDDIIQVDGSSRTDVTNKSTWIAADALVTNRRGVCMLLPLADCNGVIVYDPAHGVLSLAHVGWHGSVARLPQKLVTYLHENYQSDPTKLLVYMSPSIKPDSYFDPDPVQKQDPDWNDYLVKRGANYHIDIFGYVRDQFLAGGVLASNLEAVATDVGKSQNYMSHFVSKQSGSEADRFAVICGLAD